jgi:hypothetical protein
MYKKVDLKEGVPVQYVGVYVTRWQCEWGQPTVGFHEVEEKDETLQADLLSFVRDFYDHYADMGEAGERMAEARALIERADAKTQ